MAPVNKLTPASTLFMDTKVWSAAFKLQDSALLTKLYAAARDMPALEVCLTSFYNRVRAAERRESKESREPESTTHSLAFAELLDYIEETHRVQATVPVFQLSNLIHLYSRSLEQLGINDYSPHVTRFKEKLQVHIPGPRAHIRGREILLTFEDDIGQAIIAACWYDSDAIFLSKAAKIFRRDLLTTKSIFDGTCTSTCQEDSVPQSLISLINMILEGPSIEDQYANDKNQAALSVSQIIKFNNRKRPKKDTAGTTRHSRDQETPLPLYLVLSIHSQTRSRSLIDIFHHLGLCISYDRLLRLSSELARGVSEHYAEIGVVCPPQLKKDIFTTAACDNIDYNPSSRTVTESFHGTGISLIQHSDPNFTWVGMGMCLSEIRPHLDLYHLYQSLIQMYLQCQSFLRITLFHP